MNTVLFLNKQVGETPLACIERFRKSHPEYEGVKMTYAGRLDPIAEGLLIVLTGDKVHEKDKYSSLNKTYECTAILGVATDTYDVLGMSDEVRSPFRGAPRSGEGYEKALMGFIGTFQQSYPPYSSKTVDGKQLHQIARSGDLKDVDIPSREVTVHDITSILETEISQENLHAQIIRIISQVSGDFRQAEISHQWNEFFTTYHHDAWKLVTFTITVSSGTYIRGIVHSLGEKLGTGACILALKRTCVGEFSLSDKNLFLD